MAQMQPLNPRQEDSGTNEEEDGHDVLPVGRAATGSCYPGNKTLVQTVGRRSQRVHEAKKTPRPSEDQFSSSSLSSEDTDMAKVQVLNVAVLDNPSPFGNPFQFEITFECMEDLPEGE